VDDGTEFPSGALDEWAPRRGVCGWTSPGQKNPRDNGMIESFNGRLRDECLNTHEFTSMDDLRQRLEARR
jgi:putative transposase